jgi:hypothetical protein
VTSTAHALPPTKAVRCGRQHARIIDARLAADLEILDQEVEQLVQVPFA